MSIRGAGGPPSEFFLIFFLPSNRSNAFWPIDLFGMDFEQNLSSVFCLYLPNRLMVGFEKFKKQIGVSEMGHKHECSKLT